MNKRRCTSALVLGAIVFLCTLVVVVWVQFSQGAFDRHLKRQQQYGAGGGGGGTATVTTTTNRNNETIIDGNDKNSKDYIKKSYLDELGSEEVFVKPLKINPDDQKIVYDLNKFDEPILNSTDHQTTTTIIRHHSGHFRHKTAEIWDPHPKYEIDAFGEKLILELENDNKFIAPDLHIVHHDRNRAESVKHDIKLNGCFYTGKLRNDKDSTIAVDLCHGMTGYIKSSLAYYYIEPAENFTIGSLDTILHRIKKSKHYSNAAEKDDIIHDINIGKSFDILFTKHNNGSQSIIEDDFPEEIIQSTTNQKRQRKRRSTIMTFDEDLIYDSLTLKPQNENYYPEILRSTRNIEQQQINNIFSKRSNEYFVKVLVVADGTMLDYHKTYEDLIKYILILMAHVALLFKEPSIGNAINVAVVHIRILNPVDSFSHSLSQDMLQEFCRWKQQHIHDTSHDVALLLTRRAICKNSTSCTTLGVAEVDSMCRTSGCTIVRDKGLSTSYTIAHEFGHTMSMLHDDDSKCESHNNGSKTNNIMSRTTRNDSKPYMWSACSKYYATEFLDSTKSKCLLKQPSINEISSNYSQMLPGDIFEVDKQCELEYGPEFTMCVAPFNKLCGHLWCRDSKGSCHSQFSPWAEGTKCGPYSWCYKRECIEDDRSQFFPIDGGWGEWQPWGICSRTCGGGIMKSIRVCDSPKPENGGNYCTGKSVQYSSCNTNDCDENEIDFRAEQCGYFNGKTRNLPNLNEDVKWVAKYGMGSLERPEDYCRLYCKPQQSSAYYALKDKVADGTKCGKSGFDICINGRCLPGGCDNKLDSKVVLDECGVCGGDNSTCQEITGTYNKTADQVSYNRVVLIPKGSSNIIIRQYSYGEDDNFLALRDGETNNYILNGQHMLMLQEIEIQFGQVTLKYSGSTAQVEEVTTLRNQKLPKALIVEVLSIKNLSPPNILYQYLISKNDAPKPFHPPTRFLPNHLRGIVNRYGWYLPHNHYTKCSSICNGTQTLTHVCVNLATQKKVSVNYCDRNELQTYNKMKMCNMDCYLNWQIQSKSACTPHCGKGYRDIYYNCTKISKSKPYGEFVNENHCNVLPKPIGREECYNPCNTTRWDYSDWSECSKTCGGGMQRRSAKCVNEINNPIDDFHCANVEKIIEQKCNLQKCPIWTIADTSPCSVPCGGGYQNVTYYCVLGGQIINTHFCDTNMKPSLTKSCNEHSCGRWVAEDSFLPCSVTCGEGVERRRYVCKKFDSEEILDQIYCRRVRIQREDTRKCFKQCDDKLSYNNNPRYVPDNNNNDYTYRTFQWRAGNWSACSDTCGGGTSTQIFHCRNNFGQENPTMCDSNQKPQNLIRCNEQPCSKWIIGAWGSNCDSKCERHRLVKCMDNAMNAQDDHRCDLKQKPSDSDKCKLEECPHAINTIPNTYFDTKENRDKRYRWKIGPWKQCTAQCGKGTRRRKINCEDTLNDIAVVDSLCKHKRKPEIMKSCERYKCKYAWIEGHWSTCSTTCNYGFKTRNVTCHKVHPGGIVDPIPLPETRHRILHKNYCTIHHKPMNITRCLLSNCGDEYVWETDEWKPCSHRCGKKGRQIRNLYCVSVKTKGKVPKQYCSKQLRPLRKRKCNQWKCIYDSCKEIKYAMKTKENKDYVLSIHGKTALIYCYKMDTAEPQEYISLHPDTENYSEFYDKRLMNLQSCPYNGERRDTCNCDEINSNRHGFTKFWKVRLNITTMKIIEDDFTFSKQLKGTRIPYGQAGDCYSSSLGCAQGRFSIDLTHTSFKLSNYIRWDKTGTTVSLNLHKTATTVQGKCGGYCGQCFPERTYGLLVEIT